MNPSERFLILYREYESLARSLLQLDPQTIEDRSPEQTAARLRMCRLFRNYLSHNNDPRFIVPSSKMLDFLEAQVKSVKLSQDVVKKHLKKPEKSVVNYHDKLSDVLAKMTTLKTSRIVCLTTKETGTAARLKTPEYIIYAIHEILAVYLVSKAAKLPVIKPSKQKPVFVRPDQLMSELDLSQINICTDDGTETGKLLGVVYV